MLEDTPHRDVHRIALEVLEVLGFLEALEALGFLEGHFDLTLPRTRILDAPLPAVEGSGGPSPSTPIAE
ncbi:hypothetical protein ACFVH0_33095 [Streptomyces sp. NPDC127117]|uniref:hypothetical protein n=1 Tax=Streptomyces sp. NPDC127117 TaxID=3345368 RepID=UPI003636EDDE